MQAKACGYQKTFHGLRVSHRLMFNWFEKFLVAPVSYRCRCTG
jgi:hypothetical protein